MSPETIDLYRIADALNSVPELRYVLIGGLAVVIYGGTRITQDADFAIAFDLENRRRLVEALAPLHPRPLRLSPTASWEWDEKCIRAPWSIFQTDAGRVDIIVRLPGVDSFNALYERSQVIDLGGPPLRIASIEDLLTMKREADRDRDRDDVNQLLAIQRLQAESRAPLG